KAPFSAPPAREPDKEKPGGGSATKPPPAALGSTSKVQPPPVEKRSAPSVISKRKAEVSGLGDAVGLQQLHFDKMMLSPDWVPANPRDAPAPVNAKAQQARGAKEQQVVQKVGIIEQEAKKPSGRPENPNIEQVPTGPSGSGIQPAAATGSASNTAVRTKKEKNKAKKERAKARKAAQVSLYPYGSSPVLEGEFCAASAQCFHTLLTCPGLRAHVTH
ncbi:hypothetical protein CYMTET_27667, partial [Cymbomonas tetramitiformis]